MRTLFLAILLLLSGWVEAQQLSVKSFRKLENDLSARGSEGRMDQNGDKCAIIKVVTNEKGFVFEPDALGLVGSVGKTSEIWLYVPYGAKRLTIKHPELGMLRDYAYPERIEKACVYELVLTTGRVRTVVEEEIGGQWLVLTTEPEEAMVYIDEVYEAGESGRVQKFLPLGRHTYRVDYALYHPEAGQVELTSGERTELKVRLRPAFGYVEVTSEPESGARVLIDGEEVGETPYRSDRLKSGEHRIEVLKAMYAPTSQMVTVTDGHTLPVRMQLSANYGTLTFQTDASSEIWINNEKKGEGSWSGRLNAGMYILEVRRPFHRSVRQSLEVKAGDVRTLSLGSPEPIYGILNISSSPGDAEIWIDGRSYGTTPRILKDILIGEHTLELKKEGCAGASQLINVEEGKILPVHLTLSSGRSVTLQTDREGDILYVDGKRVGVSPQKLELSYGIHTIRAERGEQHTEKELEVTETGGESVVTLGFGLLSQIRWSSSVTPKQKEILSRLIGNMVRVDGGSFEMGATSEQGSNVTSDEELVHQVTLSDYYIGKYEVHQSEWEAVMGNNPSYFKGDDLPVEQVSWEDCHEFIRRLNALTGLNFKLPTEAQWEYAARGGRWSKGYKYSGSNDLGEVGWSWENSGVQVLTGEWDEKKVKKNHCQTHPVGEKHPNELGLYDMSGNVWEWCQDWYGYYNRDTQVDSAGPVRGSYRVARGGCWFRDAWFCRVSYRNCQTPVHCYSYLGLRLVC